MQIITRDRIVYSFSRDHRPVQEANVIYGSIETLGISTIGMR